MTFPIKELPEGSLDALIARERARVIQPLNEWQTLSKQLLDDGLIRSAGTSSSPIHKRSVSTPAHLSSLSRWSARVVAGATVFVAGIVIGHTVTIGDRAVPPAKSEVVHQAAASTSSHAFTSVEQARQAVIRSQGEYQRAMAYLAAADTGAPLSGTPTLYRERLAALDQVMSATQQALRDSPHDPLLKQYYQSTLGAREATAQQLEQTLPVGGRVSHF